MTSTTCPSLWKHRIFQQLFWAHALSLIGSGLTSLALGLLAHELVGASASTVLGFTLMIRIIMANYPVRANYPVIGERNDSLYRHP